MESTPLLDLADGQLEAARQAPSARSSRTIQGGHDRMLRETVIALLAGHELAEHESPGEATLQVLRGRVRLTAGDQRWDGTVGDHVIIPRSRHALTALEDAAVLLTVVKTVT
ncbi:cupin domain-containing protein [uncultured Phycicoccus sp.]|uniref:cupin domain-containing protein n=1 Tax=uncultured Phycicoccus sp. TaxID=661422 RepID=UPI00261E43CA|nr:cupin domain-containing protein [uncultured Phycicoccus sp.]